MDAAVVVSEVGAGAGAAAEGGAEAIILRGRTGVVVPLGAPVKTFTPGRRAGSVPLALAFAPVGVSECACTGRVGVSARAPNPPGVGVGVREFVLVPGAGSTTVGVTSPSATGTASDGMTTSCAAFDVTSSFCAATSCSAALPCSVSGSCSCSCSGDGSALARPGPISTLWVLRTVPAGLGSVAPSTGICLLDNSSIIEGVNLGLIISPALAACPPVTPGLDAKLLGMEVGILRYDGKRATGAPKDALALVPPIGPCVSEGGEANVLGLPPCGPPRNVAVGAGAGTWLPGTACGALAAKGSGAVAVAELPDTLPLRKPTSSEPASAPAGAEMWEAVPVAEWVCVATSGEGYGESTERGSKPERGSRPASVPGGLRATLLLFDGTLGGDVGCL